MKIFFKTNFISKYKSFCRSEIRKSEKFRFDNFFSRLHLFFLIAVFISVSFFYSSANERSIEELIGKSEFEYDNLKKQNVVFNFGAFLSSRNQFLIGEDNKYFTSTSESPFEFVPNNQWSSINSVNIWTSMIFKEGNFIKLAVDGTFLLTHKSVLPVFNISELFVSWKYPLGRIIIGRTIYSLNSLTNFSGTLDGINIQINSPFLNFKSFFGFSGFTGVFHPWYNNFNISAYDNSFREQTNLTNLIMTVQLNGEQSRRIFLSTDFDIHYLFFNINPYFLMQLDISNIDVPNFKNNDYTFNTFTIGILNKIRILSPLYLYFDISGVFGVIQDIEYSKTIPITAFAFQSELRYTFTGSSNSALSLCYSTGSGTPKEENNSPNFRAAGNKFQNYIYYGDFKGGFVLEPMLYNIHSIGIKFISNINNFISGYIYGFQTLKMYKESGISDPKAVLNDFNVGTEFNAGLSFKFNSSVSLSVDGGVFIPQTAYSDKTPRIKAGLILNIIL